MSSGLIAATAVDSLVGPAASSVTQPTAQQAARFEQQLHQQNPSEPTHYGAPVMEMGGLGSDLHSMVDFAGQVSSRLGADLAHPATQIDVRGLPPEMQQQLRLQQEFSESVRSMNATTLEFGIIGKGVELAENFPKTLYQQA